MGNKRQRLARRKFTAVTGDDGTEDHKDEHAEDREQDGKSVGIGASETGKPQRHGEKKNNVVKKRKVNEIDGEQGSLQDVIKVSENLGKELERKGSAGDSRSKSSDGQNGAQGKDEKTKKKPGSKHPLRMPGMKPGEGCFLCKATDHIAKLCPTKSARDRKKICLLCREIGHTLKNCPTSFEAQETKFCYNCGENGHRLAECKKPLKDGGTAFAECFVCKQRGHLSKTCPTNPHGIYPKGGCCKLCGEVTHLARDCPTKKAGGRIKLQISTGTAQPGSGGKRTVFISGDDLGDDFVPEDGAEGTIIGALSFGSDDEAIGNDLEQRPMKNIWSAHKLKINKVQRDRNIVGSSRKQQTPKVIKFQRPK